MQSLSVDVASLNQHATRVRGWQAELQHLLGGANVSHPNALGVAELASAMTELLDGSRRATSVVLGDLTELADRLASTADIYGQTESEVARTIAALAADRG